MTGIEIPHRHRPLAESPPPASPSQISSLLDSERWPGLAIGGMAAAFTVAALSSDGGSDDSTVLCPFRRCTGAYCPGCGGTRAIGHLLRGDIVGSWHQHPYVILLAAQALVFGGISITDRGRQRLRRVWFPLVLVNVAVMFVTWAFRLAIGDIPGL